MAGNTDNLRTLTPEEARKIGQKGGIASGIARAEKKKARELMKLILELGVTGDKNKKFLDTLGIPAEEQDNKALMLSRMFAKAAATGDYNAARSVLEIAGELTEHAEQQAPTINITVAAATVEDIDGED